MIQCHQLEALVLESVALVYDLELSVLASGKESSAFVFDAFLELSVLASGSC